jgi:hypothetical protein
MKNKITETDWENVIDAEIDINSACSNFTKTFPNIAKTCRVYAIHAVNPNRTKLYHHYEWLPPL